MIYRNRHYTIRIKPNGMVELKRKKSITLFDRGCLHEVVDRDHRDEELAAYRKKHPRLDAVDRSTGLKHTELFQDAYKKKHHYLSHRGKSKVTRKSEYIFEIESILGTLTGELGAIRSVTTLRVDLSPKVVIEACREYLQDIQRAGDGSMCFLSPGGFAKKFHLYSAEGGPYATRDDNAAWVKIGKQPGVISTTIPVRCRAAVDQKAWACLMGEFWGFGVIMLQRDAGADGLGEIRCTRPRPPAYKKFDEIELQWSEVGPRAKGQIESARFIVMPCRKPEEVRAVFEEEVK